MKTKLILFFVIILFQSCKTRQLQSKTSSPKIENQLEGELDYTKGGLKLVQWQKNGDEITLGRIDEMGNVYMDLPEYDIKALGRNHMNYTLEGQFNILNCKLLFLNKLVYFEKTLYANNGLKREKQLKKWNRKWKENLINDMNPDWVDLSWMLER